MYYVEKWINGKLYFKITPKGEWQEFTIGQYKQKIIDLEKQVENLNLLNVSKAEGVSLPLDKLSEEWTKVKEELELKGNAGEMGNYYAMFMHGWRGRNKEGFWQ